MAAPSAAAGVAAGPFAAEGAPVSAAPSAAAGVAAGPFAAEGAAVSAVPLAAAGFEAWLLAVGGGAFGAPFWAARRITGISLKNVSHVGDNSIR